MSSNSASTLDAELQPESLQSERTQFARMVDALSFASLRIHTASSDGGTGSSSSEDPSSSDIATDPGSPTSTSGDTFSSDSCKTERPFQFKKPSLLAPPSGLSHPDIGGKGDLSVASEGLSWSDKAQDKDALSRAFDGSRGPFELVFTEGFRIREPLEPQNLYMMSLTAYPQYSHLSFEEMRYRHCYGSDAESKKTMTISSSEGTFARKPADTNDGGCTLPTVPAQSPGTAQVESSTSESPASGRRRGDPANVGDWLKGIEEGKKVMSVQPAFKGLLLQDPESGRTKLYQSITLLPSLRHLSFEEHRMSSLGVRRLPTFSAPTAVYKLVPSYEGELLGYELWGKVPGAWTPTSLFTREMASVATARNTALPQTQQADRGTGPVCESQMCSGHTDGPLAIDESLRETETSMEEQHASDSLDETSGQDHSTDAAKIRLPSGDGHVSSEEHRMQHYRNDGMFTCTFGAPTPAYMIMPSCSTYTMKYRLTGYQLRAKVTEDRVDVLAPNKAVAPDVLMSHAPTEQARDDSTRARETGPDATDQQGILPPDEMLRGPLMQMVKSALKADRDCPQPGENRSDLSLALLAEENLTLMKQLRAQSSRFQAEGHF